MSPVFLVPRFPLPNDCRYFLTEKRRQEGARPPPSVTLAVVSSHRIALKAFSFWKNSFSRESCAPSLYSGVWERFIPVAGPSVLLSVFLQKTALPSLSLLLPTTRTVHCDDCLLPSSAHCWLQAQAIFSAAEFFLIPGSNFSGIPFDPFTSFAKDTDFDKVTLCPVAYRLVPGFPHSTQLPDLT